MLAGNQTKTIKMQNNYLAQLKLTCASLSLQNVLKVTSNRAVKVNTMAAFAMYSNLIREDQCVTITFTEEQAKRFAYRPKMLADQLYENVELYFLILRVNHMKSVSDFSEERLMDGILIPVTSIDGYLDEILIKEKLVINRNRAAVLADVNSIV